MKTLYESIFDDDDIIKDADSTIFKELGIDEMYSMKDGELYIDSSKTANTSKYRNIFFDNISEIKQRLSNKNLIKYIHRFNDRFDNRYFDEFKEIEHCKFYVLNHNSDVGNIKKIDFLNAKGERFDTYVKGIEKIINKQKPETILFSFTGYQDDYTYMFNIFEDVVRMIGKKRPIKHIILPIHQYIYDIYDDVNAPITDDIKKCLDDWFSISGRKRLFFSNGIYYTIWNMNKILSVEKTGDTYKFKHLTFNTSDDINKQLNK